ncbi:MAG: DUF5683 domain-containing protein [Candidatus Zixiibacteriota bacterium]
MKINAAKLSILILLFSLPAMAVDLPNSKLELNMQSLKNSGFNTINALATNDEIIDDEFNIGFEDDASIYEYDYRSPKKAFLFSLIIPGWGQKYTQSPTWKTVAFIGLEAGMWMGFFNFHNKGNKKTDEYEKFANDHWYENSYRDWLLAPPSPPFPDTSFTEDDFTHILPDSRTQQFFEMIGKYDQFRGGWDDYWLPVDTNGDGLTDIEGFLYFEDSTQLNDTAWVIKNISPNRSAYNDMRAKANDLLNQANQFIAFAIINHLLSALDAALAANRYNKKKASEMWLTFRADMKKYSATEEIPIIRATLRF